jgi:thioredoxin reductase (NADPH)
MSEDTYDIAVIGAGITGLTAAHHAALNGHSVVNISDSELWGGLVANVGALEGYPTATPASGLDLALALYTANTERGVEFSAEGVTSIARRGAGFAITGPEQSWTARAVIAASGARLKMLDVPGAHDLIGKGVSQCAWCDGGLYKAADVVVVGGGDAALEEALHLAELCGSVTIVTRGERLKARASYVQRAADLDGIRFRWASEIDAVLGATGVDGVRVRDLASGKTEDIACRAVFVFIGLKPETAYLGSFVERSSDGAILTDAAMATAIPGLFAAGAVRHGYGGRLTQATGEATTAVLAASAYLEKLKS